MKDAFRTEWTSLFAHSHGDEGDDDSEQAS